MGDVGRGELTDAAWAVLEPQLPGGGRRGKPWANHRRVLNGILWKLRTGAPWRDLPERSGPRKPRTSGCGCEPRTAPGASSRRR